MSEAEKPRWRGLSWKRTAWIIAGLIALAVVGVVLLPSLLPESVIKSRVEEALSTQMGRAVTVESASFRWGEGLRIRGLRISQDANPASDPLVTARELVAQFDPVEVARTVSGTPVPLESIRLDGPEVWLVLRKDGHWNVADIITGKVRQTQVTDGTVHLRNEVVGHDITLTKVFASVGELQTSGQGYVNVTAELPTSGAAKSADKATDGDDSAAGRPGRFVITANLDSLDLKQVETLSGSAKFEWTDVAWPQVAAVVTSDPWLAHFAGSTTGRMGSTFGKGKWTAEGAVEAADIRLAESGPLAGAPLPQVILGFQLSQDGPGRPVDLTLVKLTAPGVDLTVRGKVTPVPPEERNVAPPPALAKQAPDRLRKEFGIKEANLTVRANLTWTPLCRSFAPMARLVEKADQFSGAASVTLHLATTPDGPELTGSADLTPTLLVWPDIIQKDLNRILHVEWVATATRDFTKAELKHLELYSEAGRTDPKNNRPLPLVVVKGQVGPKPADTRVEVRATVDRMERLLAAVPVLRGPLGPIEVSGPLSLYVTCAPEASTEGPTAWNASLNADLTGTRFTLPSGGGKRRNLPATLDVVATVAPDSRTADFRDIRLHLASTTLEWTGSARVAWPEKDDAQPSGLLAGKLKISSVEGAGALLAPDVFTATSAPVAGEAVFDVQASLAGGRVTGKMKADLTRLAVRVAAEPPAGAVAAAPAKPAPAPAAKPGAAPASKPAAAPAAAPAKPAPPPVAAAPAPAAEKPAVATNGPAATDYFYKPAGQPASMVLTGMWEPGRGGNYIEGEADVTLPGMRLGALGHGELRVFWVVPPEDAAAPGKPGAAVLRTQFAPTSTVELKLAVDDLARTADLAPALRPVLADRKIQGAAVGRLVLSLRPRAMHVEGQANLSDASLEVAPYIRKPAGMSLDFDLAADIMPPANEQIEVFIGNIEARMGRSVTGLKGRLKIAEPGSLKAIPTGPRALALLEEADVELRADWQHEPSFRQALPWLEPLYTRGGLEGRTTVTVAFKGTPVKGKVLIDADATACRILNADALVKPAGTPAAVHIQARYGEVPGELVLDELRLKLADATASADGRFLFDDPRLVSMAPPTTWSLRTEVRAPDAAALAALFPARLADLKPAGGVTLRLKAAADPHGAEVESCDVTFQKAHLVWLGRTCEVDGTITYDGRRLATEGLHMLAGESDVTLIAYVSEPDRAPTGSVFLKGKSLRIKELQEMIQQTSEQLAVWTGAAEPAGAKAAPPTAVSELAARRLQRILARAQLSAEIAIDRVSITVPEWNTTYDLEGLTAEGRLADRQFTIPKFRCSLNHGQAGGTIGLDFRPDVPVLSVDYNAENLQMADNLKPFIELTFPGMKVYGTLSQRQVFTQRLAAKSYAVGRGEVVLIDGLMEGPGAPEYITAVLPGLKLTQYRFRRMSNVFENLENGNTDNRMLFNGQAYDVFIFGISHPDGRFEYTLGVDLSLSLGSKVVSRTLDQGKLPMLHYTGRIVGAQYAERNINYVLPHEFAYDVFVRRNLLLQVIRSIGEKPPEIRKPDVAPTDKQREKTS